MGRKFSGLVQLLSLAQSLDSFDQFGRYGGGGGGAQGMIQQRSFVHCSVHEAIVYTWSSRGLYGQEREGSFKVG